MSSIYARGSTWWCRLKNEHGKWISKSTGCKLDNERGARKYAEVAQAKLDARRKVQEATSGPLTLRAYVAKWLDRRRVEGHDWKADRGRLEKHVLPVLGDRVLAEIRTAEIAALVRRLRFESDPPLASRTVRNVYSVLAAAFRDAAIDDLIDASPCILTEAQLGRIRDKDPEWRGGALFTREEAEQMISDPRIPLDRQLVYGFGLLAGMRPGEVAALRWRHYDPSSEPLGRLVVALSYNTKRNVTKGTKTETTKSIPVHPTLAAMLAEWKLGGWAAMMGRTPGPEDLIVPLPPETIARRTRRTGEPHRGYDYSGKRWREHDLPMLGWRPRSLYDTKSTFITLAIEDGADAAIIRDRVTHTKPKRSAFDGYDRGSHWISTCAEVAKLRISRRPSEPFATVLATEIESSTGNWGSGGGYRIAERGRHDPRATAVSVEKPRIAPAKAGRRGRDL